MPDGKYCFCFHLQVPKSGLKTAKEVHMLVCSLLYAHRITDASEVTTHLFGRIHSTFLSCKPYSFAPFRPRDRFFAEFEIQVGLPDSCASFWGVVVSQRERHKET